MVMIVYIEFKITYFLDTRQIQVTKLLLLSVCLINFVTTILISIYD